MDLETRTALSLNLLDWLRGQVADHNRWPSGPVYDQAVAAAGGLIDLVASPSSSPTDAAVGQDAPSVAPAPAMAYPIGRSAPIDPDQHPGNIPDTLLPRSAPVQPQIIAEIESNARAGEPFQARLQVRASDGRPMQVVACEVPEALGLTYAAGLLTGIAHQPGEHRLAVTCQDPDDPAAPTCRAVALLVVNADPRALWKDLASDRDATGWKPDTAAVRLPGAHDRQILLASRRGRSHAHIGTMRDDDYAWCVTAADGWNLIAVADGAGSARHSRIGSRIAAATAVEVARQRLLDDQPGPRLQDLATENADPGQARIAAYNTLGAAAFEATKAIEAKARAQGGEPRDYATTLLLAAHTRTPVGDLVATYWVGDGAIALYSTGHGVELLGMPEGGDYAGQTRFLDRSVFADGDQIMRRLNVRLVKEFTALLLMTDGVSDPWFPSDATLRESAAWAALWAELAPLLAAPDADARTLDWLNFWSRGNHDDRTLAVSSSARGASGSWSPPMRRTSSSRTAPPTTICSASRAGRRKASGSRAQTIRRASWTRVSAGIGSTTCASAFASPGRCGACTPPAWPIATFPIRMCWSTPAPATPVSSISTAWWSLGSTRRRSSAPPISSRRRSS